MRNNRVIEKILIKFIIIKKRSNFLVIEENWMSGKWFCNFLAISGVTTDSAEIIEGIIEETRLRWGLEILVLIFLKN